MNTLLADELIRRGKLDQDMRNKYLKDNTFWDESVDKENTEYMKKVISDYGWPKISYVGIEAANIAWLLVQHADHDLNFQELSLKLMKALPKREVNKSNVAYLEDRVLVAQNMPQLYGTQFYNKGASLIPRKIKDKPNLDNRRREMGLDSFSEYEKTMRKLYGKK